MQIKNSRALNTRRRKRIICRFCRTYYEMHSDRREAKIHLRDRTFQNVEMRTPRSAKKINNQMGKLSFYRPNRIKHYIRTKIYKIANASRRISSNLEFFVSQNRRPELWAKNLVSIVYTVRHFEMARSGFGLKWFLRNF